MSETVKRVCDLGVGDDAILVTAQGSKIPTRVIKVTKVSLRVAALSNTQFKRTSGFERWGDPWHPCYVEPASQQALRVVERQVERRTLRRRLAEVDYGQLSNEQLRELVDLLDGVLGVESDD